MKLPTFSKQFWVALTTMAVIGALFAYYLLVYVKGREDSIRQEKYRALERYGENMIHTRGDYEKTLSRILERERDLVRSQFPKFETEYNKKSKVTPWQQIEQQAKKAIADIAQAAHQKSSTCCDGTVLYRLDSLQKKLQDSVQKNANSAFWQIHKKDLRDGITSKIRSDLPKAKYDGYINETDYEDLMHNNFNLIYFKFSANNPKWFNVFSIPAEDFVYPPSQFDQFFIIKKYDESVHQHEGVTRVPADESYQTFENRIDLQSIDSFMVKENGLLTNHFRDLRLADTDYKLFVHTIEFTPGEDWILCGLTKTENYKSQARAADPLLITVAVLLLLSLIMAMPILKLLIMNTFERLSAANVWLTGFSVVCGSAVLFLILWAGSHNIQERGAVDNKLREISNKLSGRFLGELSSMYSQLKSFNADPFDCTLIYLDSVSLKERKMNFCPDSSYVIGDFLNKVKSVIGKQDTLHYYQFNYVLWISDDGHPKIAFTPDDKELNYPMPDINKREYFRFAKNDTLWYLHGDASKGFALQSIQSWTNHSPEAGLGIPIKNHPEIGPVLAMSTRLHSVMNPVLPPGYSFCIMDTQGEVWFHSDVDKNHQENLLHEIDRLGKLSAAVEGRGVTYLSTDYNGKRSRLYIQPIDNLPLYAVVFHENNFQRAPVVLTIFLAFSLILILFLVQGTQLLVLFGCKLRSGGYKPNAFFLDILRPGVRDGNDIFYKKSIVTQIVIAALLTVVYFFGDLSWSLVFITTPVMLMMYNQALYYSFAESSAKGEERHDAKIRLLFFLGISFFLIVLTNAVAFPYLQHARSIVASQLLLAIALAATWIMEAWPGVTWSFWPNSRKCKEKYYTYLILWWILISFLPVTFFYKVAHYEESLLWTKYLLLKSSEAVADRSNLLDEKLRFLTLDSLEHQPDGKIQHHLDNMLRHYPDSVGNYLSYPTNARDTDYADTVEHDAFHEILFEVWPRLDGPFGASSATAFKEAQDKKWIWCRADNGIGIKYMPNPNQPVEPFALLKTFNPFGGAYGFWILLLTVLAVLFVIRIIFFCTKYIFGINIVPEDSQIEAVRAWEQIRNSNRAFIVGLPLSEKRAFITKAFNYISPSSIDLQEPDFKFVDVSDLYILKHFEFGITDHDVNQKKLALFQSLLTKHDRKIIILSAVEPTAILEVYRRRVCDFQKELADDPKKDNSKLLEYKAALRNWRNVLSEFMVYYKTISPAPRIENYKEYILHELNACVFLQRLFDTKPLPWSKIEEADFIRRVEEIAEPYYNALWNAFSETEKLLLFDLARDGFVNLKSHRTIRALMQKGVIVHNQSLEIMNHSFRNFILSIFRQDEEIEITRQMQQKGTWSSIRTVLVLVLIAIVVFIALAQKELFTNVNAFVAALAGALTMLTKFGGLFGSGSKSKE